MEPPVSYPNSPSCADVSAWIQKWFVTSFANEANPTYWRKGDDGVFAITLLCLSYCTAAAGLMSGTNNPDSQACIDLIRQRFKGSPAPSGDRYEKRAEALYMLFRHGLAHQRVPGILDVGDGKTLGWALGREKDRARHLMLRPSGVHVLPSGNPDGHHRLFVQPDILFEDCLRVFQEIQADSSKKPAMAQTIYNGAVMKRGRRVGDIGDSIRRIVDAHD
jgi:hypothetical protein